MKPAGQDMFRSIIKTVLPGAALHALPLLTIGPSAEAADDIRGCWEQEGLTREFPSVLIYCFRSKGRLQGWVAADGGGYNFDGTWGMEGNSTIRMSGEEKDNLTCRFRHLNQDGLLLHGCSPGAANGSYKTTVMPDD